MFGKKKEKADTTLYCSFCGKSQHEVAKLIAGPEVFICNECTELCWDIVNEDFKAALVRARSEGVSPAQVLKLFDKTIAGHLRAKYILSLAILERMIAKGDAEAEGGEWSPDRILLVGPVGSGKRLLAQALAQAMDAPFAAITEKDLDERTPGEVWEQVALKLLSESSFNFEKATDGVVYLEINSGLPASLAGFCDHRLVTLTEISRRRMEETELEFDLSRLLIMIGGPFLGLPSRSGPVSRDQMARFDSRLDREDCRALAQALNGVSREALLDYGLPRAIVDRIPYVAAMRDRYDGECEEETGA